jgi:DNA-binding NtrC family response regulator
MARILVVDDDEILRSTLEQLLTIEGHDVVTAPDGLVAERVFRAEPFHLIITDIIMPNQEGVETVVTLHREFPNVGVIAMSGGVAMSQNYLAMAARLGAHYTLAKPFTPQQLKDAIDETLARVGAAPSGPSVKPGPAKPE